MTSPSLKSLGSPPPLFPPPTTRKVSFNLKNPRFSLKSPRCTRLSFESKPISPTHEFAVNSSTATAEAPYGTTVISTTDKLRLLASEFRSMSEPIERVKRLLLYAAALPPFDESGRIPANRVTGCTTQVWLDVKMDELGKMRFRADSDSEISKGFCSCLIWILDGATAEEVVGVKTEDLSEMNVGVHGKAQSRVNTWHNVMIAMQKRTVALVATPRVSRFSPSEFSNPLIPLYYDFTI